MNSRTTYYI